MWPILIRGVWGWNRECESVRQMILIHTKTSAN